jgi:hypothetical protein
VVRVDFVVFVLQTQRAVGFFVLASIGGGTPAMHAIAITPDAARSNRRFGTGLLLRPLPGGRRLSTSSKQGALH